MPVRSKGITLYTLKEVARLLGVDDQTTRRWAANASIETIRDDVDQRRRLFTSEHVEILRKLHPTAGGEERGDPAKLSLDALTIQIEELKRSQAEVVDAVKATSNRLSEMQSALLSITASMATITEAIATIVTQRAAPTREPVAVGGRDTQW